MAYIQKLYPRRGVWNKGMVLTSDACGMWQHLRSSRCTAFFEQSIPVWNRLYEGEQIDDNNNDNLNATTKGFLRAISTTCKAMGHTEQAAKDARRRCFAMVDFFGLNSLFMSTTPDDECSFRVRLYYKPHYWVS